MLELDGIAQPIVLTLTLATVVTAILVVVATPIAWWLARSRHAWREAVGAVVALPLVLPPTVLGFYLLIALGPNGPGGSHRVALGRADAGLLVRGAGHRRR